MRQIREVWPNTAPFLQNLRLSEDIIMLIVAQMLNKKASVKD